MGLWTYSIKIACLNCGMPNNLQVRKGVSVKDFVETSDCKCKNCGVKINPKTYQTEWIK